MLGRLRKSLWVYHLNTGGCNGCDIEILAALSPFYDPERLGVKLVESPRHADAFIMTGPVTHQCLPRVIQAFRAGRPPIIIAVGACACGGGIWHDSSAVLGGVEPLMRTLLELGVYKRKPVVLRIPGCPPRPHAILHGIALALGAVTRRSTVRSVEEEAEKPARQRI